MGIVGVGRADERMPRISARSIARPAVLTETKASPSSAFGPCLSFLRRGESRRHIVLLPPSAFIFANARRPPLLPLPDRAFCKKQHLRGERKHGSRRTYASTLDG